MKKRTPEKSIRNARLLLTAYWGLRMIGGGDFLKTTLRVLQMDNRFSAGKKQGETRKVRRDLKRRRASIVGGAHLGRITKKILKSARVY